MSEQESNRFTPGLCYALAAMSVFIGYTALIALAICFLQKKDAPSLVLSHYKYLIRNIMISIGLGFLAVIVVYFKMRIGVLVFAIQFWVVYFAARGSFYLYRHRSI